MLEKIITTSNITSPLGVTISGYAAISRTGGIFKAVGDVDNDGHIDYVLGAHGANKAWLIYGTENGIDADFDLSALPAESSIASLITGPDGSSFGISVTDVGYEDGSNGFAIGAYLFNAYTGRVYVFKGGSSRVDKDVSTSMDSSYGYYIDGSSTSSSFGYSLANVGDIDGDGKNDYAVSAPSNQETYVLYSSNNANIVASTSMDSSLGFSWKGLSTGNFGNSIVYLNQINDDGKNILQFRIELMQRYICYH